MRPFSCARACLLLLLLSGGTGACQRANYQFQAPVAVAYQLPLPVVQRESAVITVVAPLRKPLATILRAASQRALRVPVVAARLEDRPVQMFGTSSSPVLIKAAGPAQQEPQPSDQPVNRRSRSIAFLLALFLGSLGGHLFYLGLFKRAITYLLLTLASFAIIIIAAAGLDAGGMAGALYILLAIPGVFLFYAVAIMALIDAVRILNDGLKPKEGEYYPRFFQTRP